MREPRALLFDLDDTLYPRAWFARSGFRAVAQRLERDFGLAGLDAVHALNIFHVSHPGREFQELCRRFDLPASIVPSLVGTVRTHAPSIRLPEETAIVVRELRAGWRIGIVTNGLPATQRRKIEALGVAALVDDVLFAAEHGARTGKPDPAAFAAALDRLRVPARRAVFVGDDLAADIGGAAAAGMRTIHFTGFDPAPTGPAPAPDACVRSMLDVARVAGQLVPVEEWKHVA